MTTHPVVFEAKGRRAETLVRDIRQRNEQGKDVVLSIGEHANPERIARIIRLAVEGYDVDLVVRHAELEEYLENVAIGTAIGSGVGASGVLAAMALGNPVTLGGALAAIGIGALLGGAIGAGITPIAQITVYKFKGETRLRFESVK